MFSFGHWKRRKLNYQNEVVQNDKMSVYDTCIYRKINTFLDIHINSPKFLKKKHVS